MCVNIVVVVYIECCASNVIANCLIHQHHHAEGTAVDHVNDDAAPTSATAANDVQDHVSHNHVMCFILGSFNQGHRHFGHNRQKQCATNSNTAVMTNVLKSAWTWTTADLDNVLVNGNDLYSYMRKHKMISDGNGSGYIFVRELPREHVLFNNRFSLEYMETFTGDIDVQEYDPAVQHVAMPLDVALQRAMFEAHACLLTIRKNMCVVFKQGSRFAVFNPHARGADGGWQHNGTSIIACYNTVDALYTNITNLVQSLYAHDAYATDKLFEVTSVKAVVVSSDTVTVTDNDQQSDMVIVTADTDDESSVRLVSETNAINVTFKCLTSSDKNTICTKLGIVPSFNVDGNVVVNCIELQQPQPCYTIDIQQKMGIVSLDLCHMLLVAYSHIIELFAWLL